MARNYRDCLQKEARGEKVDGRERDTSRLDGVWENYKCEDAVELATLNLFYPFHDQYDVTHESWNLARGTEIGGWGR